MGMDAGPIVVGIPGPSGIVTYVDSTNSRSLNTVFQPSSIYATIVAYTISIACTISLTNGQSGQVILLCDANANPITTRCIVSNSNTGTLTVGLNLTNTQQATLCYLVLPGYNVKLVSSGTATIAITAQSEMSIVTS